MGGDARAQERPSPYVDNVDGGPLGVLSVEPAAATIHVKNVDGGPPVRRCRMMETHEGLIPDLSVETEDKSTFMT
jgi:hypothetical protein